MAPHWFLIYIPMGLSGSAPLVAYASHVEVAYSRATEVQVAFSRAETVEVAYSRATQVEIVPHG